MVSDTMDSGSSPEDSEHPAITKAREIAEKARKLADVPDPAVEKVKEISPIIDKLAGESGLSESEFKRIEGEIKRIRDRALKDIYLERKMQGGHDPDDDAGEENEENEDNSSDSD